MIIMSLFGMLALIGIAFLLSENRSSINKRTILGAFFIQFTLGGFALYSSLGNALLLKMSAGFTSIIGFSQHGIDFLFGGLASDVMFEIFGDGAFVFALRVLPIIVFFSAIATVLYYLGIMQAVVKVVGGMLQKALGTSKAESMSATGNIFLGPTEAPLLVKPYIPGMSRSELFAVFSGGMASIAGTMLASYAMLGVSMEYLLAASFMAAPGGLMFAKILVPETETNADASESTDIDEKEYSNVVDAAAGGAVQGMHLAFNVGCILLVFISMIAMANGALTTVGSIFGFNNFNIEFILGWLFSPIAFIIGVPMSEASLAGSFIGQKIALNEMISYVNFAPYLNGEQIVEATGALMSERTKVIISFALCGFANLGTVAMTIGGLSGMAPSRRPELASLGLKALAAGVLSNLMSATIAGFYLAL